jgi:predicted dehydrogenase
MMSDIAVELPGTKLAADGTLGTLRAVRSAFTFRLSRPDNIRFDPALGGGALMDVGCYCVNVSRTLAAAEPVEVQAWANWGATGVEADRSLRFASGLHAHFDCSLSSIGAKWQRWQERRRVPPWKTRSFRALVRWS